MIPPIRAILRLLLGTQQLDSANESGRSLVRYRRAGWSALVMLLSRGLGIGSDLIIIPMALSYLGSERFGLWMALTGFVAFLSFTDMGLGIGLQNALARCNGKEDKVSPSYYISSALFVMITVSSILLVVAVFVLPQMPLNKLLKVETEETLQDLVPTAQAVFIIFGIGLPAGVLQRIYSAYQRGYWGGLLLGLGNLLSLIAVAATIYLQAGLPVLVCAYMGTRYLVMLIGGCIAFMSIPMIRPSIFRVSWNKLLEILGSGVSALFAQVSTLLMINGPILLIANRLGTDEVTPVAVTQKLLAVATMLHITLIVPLWSAYGEAAARDDWSWIKRTHRRTLRLWAYIFPPICLLFIFTGQWIIWIWTQNESSVPSTILLIGCVVWATLQALNGTNALVLNGLNHMTGQALYGNIFSILALVIAASISSIWGAAGVVWCGVFFASLPRGFAMYLELKWVLKKEQY